MQTCRVFPLNVAHNARIGRAWAQARRRRELLNLIIAARCALQRPRDNRRMLSLQLVCAALFVACIGGAAALAHHGQMLEIVSP